ncbi:hypothetical protein [Rhodopseudomonas sp. P2A-2r]|uniref:hypothetical protein n=1 Tax=unclassified Rhodopseudomonas TaxID=2638247 RepID=UPI002234A173|nr:hypothetical protein [Rhodopseudomonas sp. P2A-2r]UZE47572.1 hypothetical protein ONR75_21990 [Rhodopseudomonas sp. P2A-2r]
MSEADLVAGRFDAASIVRRLVDWGEPRGRGLVMDRAPGAAWVVIHGEQLVNGRMRTDGHPRILLCDDCDRLACNLNGLM